jgi:hypothetical protein
MHIRCQIQESEITEILFLMEATRERDLHKSLKLLLKECEKGLWPFIDFRLKSSDLKECPRITLSGTSSQNTLCGLHLLSHSCKLILDLMITEGNKQKRPETISGPASLFENRILIYFLNFVLDPARPIRPDPKRGKGSDSGIVGLFPVVFKDGFFGEPPGVLGVYRKG